MQNNADWSRLSFVAKFIQWLLGPLIFLWLTTAGIGVFMISRAVDESFDTRLEDATRAVAAHLTPTGDPQAPLAMSAGAEALLHPDRFGDLRVALRHPPGNVYAGDPDIPFDATTSPQDGVVITGAILNDEPVRVATLRVPAIDGGPVVVQVAESMTRRHTLASSLRAESFLPQIVLLGGALALVWYGLAYVIAPMRRLKTAIDARDSLDLTPIDPTQAPQEMQPLIVSVNGLLARVGHNFESQRRFIADAAHQLRTPLAGLKSQTELALAENDPDGMRFALERIASGTERAIHIANRLLALAKAESLDAVTRVSVALVPLARSVVADFVPRAVERSIDLGFEAHDADSPRIARADPVLVGEMISNLVDNALRCTPAGGSVTVSVRHDAWGAPQLDVDDTGPGVPAAERERVFDAFYRGAHAPAGGTGLGLAIVRTIAIAHDAQVTIGDGPHGSGTQVRVTFGQGPDT